MGCRILMALSLVLFSVEEGVTAAAGGRHLRLEKYGDEPGHAPPLASFVLSDGSSHIDCIPITGQIAAHHPLLTGQDIHLSTSDFHPRTQQQTVPQLFAKEHGSCPDGSVPIMRAAAAVDKPHLQKLQRPRSKTTIENPVDSLNEGSEGKHQWAATMVPYAPDAYSGAHSHFSVNRPAVGDESVDFSLSQIWLVDGESENFSTIEVGWQVYPDLYNNSLSPHLFIFWTNNNYDHSEDPHGQHGCYNLLCAGFVQVNPRWVIAGPFLSYTALAQNASCEIEVEIEVFYSRGQHVWWLSLNNQPVGYWPASIYEGRFNGSASQVQWGGEVFFYRQPNSPVHSKTMVGSGAFPSAGYPTASYQRGLSTIDAASEVTMDANLFDLYQRRFRSNEQCYNIEVHEDPLWDTFIFFGGPGGNNVNCTLY